MHSATTRCDVDGVSEKSSSSKQVPYHEGSLVGGRLAKPCATVNVRCVKGPEEGEDLKLYKWRCIIVEKWITPTHQVLFSDIRPGFRAALQAQ